MATETASRPRIKAVLPDGKVLVPGATELEPNERTCSGPDGWGLCPAWLAGQPQVCEGARWFYGRSQHQGWQFAFRHESGVCPVTVLQPVLPIPPGD